MKEAVKEAADRVLRGLVEVENGVPGVVAMATDRRGNFYEGAAGRRELGKEAPMTPDTVFAIFSCTKAITGVAVMQLVEEGVLGLDDPAKEYAPEIAEVQVLEGFDDDGEPRLRPPRSDITLGQLMLHTAGFGYDFFNHDLLKYGEVRGVPSVVTASMASLRSVLLFDPGDRWEYGSNIDWVGKVVEGARGKRLGEVMKERIFEPLGMDDTAFVLSDAMRRRRATMHQRGDDGTLTPMPDFELPQDPEQHMGGHGLYGTVGDYMKFIRMVLDDGVGENGRVLRPETVERMAQNGLGEMKIKGLPGVIPHLSNDAEFFPGMPKSWAYTFMINDEEAPTGRPASSAGRGWRTCSTGSTGRTASAGSGRPRSSRSRTLPLSQATWTSRRRSTAIYDRGNRAWPRVRAGVSARRRARGRPATRRPLRPRPAPRRRPCAA